MKKNKLVIFGGLIFTVIMVFNIHYSSIALSSNHELSKIIALAYADGESGEIVPCYLTYDDPSIFRKDTYERKCADCTVIKGHDWADPNFCQIP